MSGLRTFAALALLSAAVGFAVSAATPASATPRPTLAEGSSATNSANFKNATATCPSGMKVYGAGVNIVDGLGKVVANTVRPSSDLRSVFVEANEVGGISTNWRVIGQAICGAPVANLHLERKSVLATPNTSKTVNVDCPIGQKTYSGAYEFENGYGEVFLTGLLYGSALTRVTVTAALDDSLLDWGITGYAICGAPAASMSMVVSTSFANDATAPKTESAFCPNGTHVHGIGVARGGAFNDVATEDLKVTAALTAAQVKAYENDATSASWFSATEVICSG